MLDEQSREDLIERITAIFTNEADATKFNEDPEGYAEEHLPEGTEGSDVAEALPEVAERTGLDFSNVASTGGGASAAGQLSHTYQTIYQQNTYIYAEEGSQVTNIQGNDNAVAQQDVDVDIDYGHGDTDEDEDTPEGDPIDPTDIEYDPTEGGGSGPFIPEDGPGAPMDDQLDTGMDDMPEPEPMPEPDPEPVAEAPEAPAEAPEPMEGMDV